MNMQTVIHPSLTAARVLDAVDLQHSSLENPGFCIRCGAEHQGLEPDARRRPCDQCGSNSVYGAEELLIMIGL